MIARFFKTIIAILLLPILIGTFKSFFVQISNISLFSDSFRLLERGILVYLLFHVLVAKPVYMYVLGHEFVHVIATWLCGGKIVSFNVSPSGGSVVTSKTNFFIELSPYFVPMYTVLLGFIYFLFSIIGISIPHKAYIFVFLVGVTLAFHFVMTSEVLKVEQPDILRSGFLFSLVIIFIFNLIVVMAFFTPLFDSVSFIKFIKTAVVDTWSIYGIWYDRIIAFAKANIVW
jgi:hypothetical protein